MCSLWNVFTIECVRYRMGFCVTGSTGQLQAVACTVNSGAML